MIQLVLKPSLTDDQLRPMMGKYIDHRSYDILVNSRTHPEPFQLVDGLTKEPKAVWVPNALSVDFAQAAFHSLRGAATVTTNRGTAAGGGFLRKRPDGTYSRTNVSKPVMSAIIGYYDRYARKNYCRSCAWNAQHPKEWEKALPLFKQISHLFSIYCPEKYALQKKVAENVHPDFLIKDTVFSTVTVNKNYQTSVHKDGLNLRDSFSCFNVLKHGVYDGGFLIFPRYRVAFDCGNTDVMFFMPQEPHGTSEIKNLIEGKSYERLSLVYYIREKMTLCGSMAEEMERGKRVHGGLDQ